MLFDFPVYFLPTKIRQLINAVTLIREPTNISQPCFLVKKVAREKVSGQRRRDYGASRRQDHRVPCCTSVFYSHARNQWRCLASKDETRRKPCWPCGVCKRVDQSLAKPNWLRSMEIYLCSSLISAGFCALKDRFSRNNDEYERFL